MTTTATQPRRKAAKPRTCCPTHADDCRFGRPHVWAGPFLLDAGRPVDGRVWSHPDDVRCGTCSNVCTADRDPASPPEYRPATDQDDSATEGES